MARVTMLDLIARTRQLIGDPAGSKQRFDADTIEDALDQNRLHVPYAELRWLPDRAPHGGIVSYYEFESDYPDWEEGAAIVRMDYTPLTPTLADWRAGRWRFDNLPAPGTPPPLFINGFCYDRFGAAVFLLELKLAQLADEYDFDNDQQKYAMSQKSANVNTLIGKLRMRAWTGTAFGYRSDQTLSRRAYLRWPE